MQERLLGGKRETSFVLFRICTIIERPLYHRDGVRTDQECADVAPGIPLASGYSFLLLHFFLLLTTIVLLLFISSSY